MRGLKLKTGAPSNVSAAPPETVPGPDRVLVRPSTGVRLYRPRTRVSSFPAESGTDPYTPPRRGHREGVEVIGIRYRRLSMGRAWSSIVNSDQSTGDQHDTPPLAT